MDEIDKYPKFSGREADPVKLATERTRTFWNRKIVKCSTPTTREGYIFREYERSDQRQYYIPCPHCGKYQILVWKQVSWPDEERRPEAIKEKRLAWYECIGCKGKIDDEHKLKAIRKGVWAPQGASVDKHGHVRGANAREARRGYWLNALYSPWLTFSEVAAEFLSSQDSIEALMNFVNSWLAEVWEEKAEETSAENVTKLAVDYPSGLVPDQVQVLTAGVDVQKDHFYYVIRGWGFGEESWLIRSVRVESWEQLIADLFQTTYLKQNKDPMSVRMACIDSGYNTDEVYNVCRHWWDVSRPIKGEEHLGGVPYRVTKIDKALDGRAFKGSILLWRIDTFYFKDKVTRMIQSGPDDPAQFHIPRDFTEDYIKQMTSEHKVIVRDRKTGRAQEVWRKKTSGAQNHYWDCEVYAASAAKMIHVEALREHGQAVTHRPGGEPAYKNKWVSRSARRWVKR
jgi:phage terminase large subunit GpA-like protein